MAGFAAALCLVSIRAAGMTTWGALCARDLSYERVMAINRAEVQALSGVQPVAASSAYLYEIARVSPVRWIHSDWMGTVADGHVQLEPPAFGKIRPQKLILTQFDYYRRFQKFLEDAKQNPDLLELQVRNLAQVAPPDASPRLRRIVQHISWAPVIVNMKWKTLETNHADDASR
jgi:hypothetical protein